MKYNEKKPKRKLFYTTKISYTKQESKILTQLKKNLVNITKHNENKPKTFYSK